MSLFTSITEHLANPPHTWTVAKAGTRTWKLVTATGVDLMERFERKMDAQAALEVGGASARLYDHESRWYAGLPASPWRTYGTQPGEEPQPAAVHAATLARAAAVADLHPELLRPVDALLAAIEAAHPELRPLTAAEVKAIASGAEPARVEVCRFADMANPDAAWDEWNGLDGTVYDIGDAPTVADSMRHRHNAALDVDGFAAALVAALNEHMPAGMLVGPDGVVTADRPMDRAEAARILNAAATAIDGPKGNGTSRLSARFDHRDKGFTDAAWQVLVPSNLLGNHNGWWDPLQTGRGYVAAAAELRERVTATAQAMLAALDEVDRVAAALDAAR